MSSKAINVVYRKPTISDIDKINHFIADIFRSVEPVCQGIGICRDCLFNWANSPSLLIAKESIDSNLSLLAEHEGELIGARLISISNRPTTDDEDISTYFKCCKNCSDKEDEFNRLLEMLYKLRNNVWKLTSSDVTKLAHREMSGIKKEYQRKGIGRQLAEIDFSDDYLKKLGIHGVVSETTSIANQSLLKSLNFQPLAEEKYSNYNIHPVDGSTSLVLNFKKL